MARDIITDLWNTPSEALRDLEVQEKIIKIKTNIWNLIKGILHGELPNDRIDPTAEIDPSVEIPEGCTIGANVVIKKGVKLSPGVSLWDWTVIEEWVELWEWVVLFGQCYVGEWVKIWDFTKFWGPTVIGEGVIIWRHNVFSGDTRVENAKIWDHNFLRSARLWDRTIENNQVIDTEDELFSYLSRFLSCYSRS